MRALVAYGTKYGSTTKVAEEIAAVLRSKDASADVLDLRTGARDLVGYDLVVVGSGIQVGAWSKEAQAFLAKNREALSKRRVAMFVCCGDVVLQRTSLEESRQKYLDDVAERYGLEPCSKALFGGVLDFAKYGFLVKAILNGAKNDFERKGIDMTQPYDFRDWAQIRSWAGDLV